MGRPKKSDKFDGFISFPCHKTLIRDLEVFRAKNGLRSRGEAARLIISRAASGKDGGK